MHNCKQMVVEHLTGTSQLKQNAKAHSYVCGICRTAFLCTTNEKMLRDHVASRHEKSTFEVGAGFHSRRCTEDDDMVPAATMHGTKHRQKNSSAC